MPETRMHEGRIGKFVDSLRNLYDSRNWQPAGGKSSVRIYRRNENNLIDPRNVLRFFFFR